MTVTSYSFVSARSESGRSDYIISLSNDCQLINYGPYMVCLNGLAVDTFT
jgi:hypothetical protein